MRTLIKYILLMAPILGLSQNIHTVNPNPGSVADFSSFSEAVESASVGDILLLHGGSYGIDTLDKRLIIYGTGYFLGENENTQSNISSVFFDQFVISERAAGAQMSGVEIGSFFRIENVSNFSISKVRVLGVLSLHNCSNVSISKSFFDDEIGIYFNNTTSGISLKNNMINGWLSINGGSGNITNSVFQNNIFNNPFYDQSGNWMINCLIRNNIFLENSNPLFGVNYAANTIQGNLFSPSMTSEIASANMVNIDMTTVFLGSENNSTDGQWQLKEDSPAKEAGINGVDAGIFGGNSPYVLSGIPSIPNIYELEVGEVGTSEGGLEIKIKVKANN